MGAANTSLAMLMIGIGLELRMEPGPSRAAARLLALRYGLCAVMAVAAWRLPLPRATALVLVIVLFAPIAAMTAGFTDEVGGDVELSTLMTSPSILVGIVTLPLLLGLLGPAA